MDEMMLRHKKVVLQLISRCTLCLICTSILGARLFFQKSVWDQAGLPPLSVQSHDGPFSSIWPFFRLLRFVSTEFWCSSGVAGVWLYWGLYCLPQGLYCTLPAMLNQDPPLVMTRKLLVHRHNNCVPGTSGFPEQNTFPWVLESTMSPCSLQPFHTCVFPKHIYILWTWGSLPFFVSFFNLIPFVVCTFSPTSYYAICV